ncbi:hypothetical protein TNCV_2855041 [Trichonephila clavipes]|nr:hypothetical protein TNCV_2855041 [Trichonephila clavipes]
MEAIASKQLQVPTVLVKLPDDGLTTIICPQYFFVESSSCTHTNCNRAMNFCQQIPHRGEAFVKWAFSKMEQDPTWVFNILWTDEKLISRFMMTLTTITVAFE